MGCKGKAPVTDRLAAYLSAHYAVAMKRAVRQAAVGSVDLKTLRALCGDVMALRRADQNAQRLRLERQRLELAEKYSIPKWRKKMELELDEMLEFVGRSKSEVRDIFSDYFDGWLMRSIGCAEEPEEHPKESIGPWPGEEAPAIEPPPAKSGEIPPPPTKSGKL